MPSEGGTLASLPDPEAHPEPPTVTVTPPTPSTNKQPEFLTNQRPDLLTIQSPDVSSNQRPDLPGNQRPVQHRSPEDKHLKRLKYILIALHVLNVFICINGVGMLVMAIISKKSHAFLGGLTQNEAECLTLLLFIMGIIVLVLAVVGFSGVCYENTNRAVLFGIVLIAIFTATFTSGLVLHFLQKESDHKVFFTGKSTYKAPDISYRVSYALIVVSFIFLGSGSGTFALGWTTVKHKEAFYHLVDTGTTDK